MASPLASGDESEPPVVRFFSASRPPSPTLFPGFLNLDVVDEKLRQRTLSPETPSAEKERIKARKPFDELVELGGIPLRPWINFRAEDLTDAQRSDDNGEEWMQCRYTDEKRYWETQMKLWRRFAKRRSQDSEPSLRTLEPIAAVAAFVAYLRGHLQRDMEDRVGPGCEIWTDYFDMEWHREFIEDVVKTLPSADARLKQLRNESGDGSAPEAPEVTRGGLMEEYNIPDSSLWMHLWNHTHATLSDFDPLEPLLPGKRRRNEADGDEDEEDARPAKRVELSANPIAETASFSGQEDQKERYTNAQQDAESETFDSSGGPSTSNPKSLSQTKTERDNPALSEESTAADNHTCERPVDTGEGITAPTMEMAETGETAERTQEPRDGHSVPVSPGLRRSPLVAVQDPLSK